MGNVGRVQGRSSGWLSRCSLALLLTATCFAACGGNSLTVAPNLGGQPATVGGSSEAPGGDATVPAGGGAAATGGSPDASAGQPSSAAGAAGADPDPRPPVGARLGRACVSDAECGGLKCIKATDAVLNGGAPPKGLCTVPCSLPTSDEPDDSCEAFGAGALCFPFDDRSTQGYCVEGCSFGAPAPGRLKCHDRPEFACNPGLLAPTGDLCDNNSPDCLPGELCSSGRCNIVLPACLRCRLRRRLLLRPVVLERCLQERHDPRQSARRAVHAAGSQSARRAGRVSRLLRARHDRFAQRPLPEHL